MPFCSRRPKDFFFSFFSIVSSSRFPLFSLAFVFPFSEKDCMEDLEEGFRCAGVPRRRFPKEIFKSLTRVSLSRCARLRWTSSSSLYFLSFLFVFFSFSFFRSNSPSILPHCYPRYYYLFSLTSFAAENRDGD